MLNEHKWNRQPICEEEIHRAERELASFLGAVIELYGERHARVSAEDWLDQAAVMDGSTARAARNWRAVTVAASSRLANRVHARAA